MIQSVGCSDTNACIHMIWYLFASRKSSPNKINFIVSYMSCQWSLATWLWHRSVLRQLTRTAAHMVCQILCHTPFENYAPNSACSHSRKTMWQCLFLTRFWRSNTAQLDTLCTHTFPYLIRPKLPPSRQYCPDAEEVSRRRFLSELCCIWRHFI